MEEDIKPGAGEMHDKREARAEGEDTAKERAAKKKVKKTKRMIYNIVATVVVLFVLFEGILGIINVQKLNNGEEPILCFGTSEETKGSEKITIYHMGLYNIKKSVGGKENKIELRPFFL